MQNNPQFSSEEEHVRLKKLAAALPEESLVITRQPPPDTAESIRLAEDRARTANWKRWGPYLSERQWGTVREDYSADSNCWDYFSHDEARSRAYRWGEDGILGLCDRECRLCFHVCLWNGKDPILKERLFGLTNSEGNHGEDVKELYYYLDSLPTHSYMRGLYKYPQREFPYAQLIEQNRQRSKHEREFELLDTGLFDDNRYWDVFVEYAKAAPDDILIQLTVANRGPDEAELHVLPTFLFRNTWSWGCRHEGCWVKPSMRPDAHRRGRVECRHVSLGEWCLETDAVSAPLGSAEQPGAAGSNGAAALASSGSSSPASSPGSVRAAPSEELGAADVRRFLQSDARWLFTDNETNTARLWGVKNASPHVKDAFHDYVLRGDRRGVSSTRGTKCAAYHLLRVPAGQSAVLKLRMYAKSLAPDPAGSFGRQQFDAVVERRRREHEEFYRAVLPAQLTPDERQVAVQAFAGLLWSKQFYHYAVEDWLQGDPDQPPPPAARLAGRNADWRHMFNRDVISMPDKWEYPWYATWDLAFHCVTLASIDAEFAKEQLLLFVREWYMHPNGALPAYEFNFSDVNPPVHAWATWQVYKLTADTLHGKDRAFLARVFHKLLLNFTWWVNRKDETGRHIFSGGFLGLDNIGVFDRSKPLQGVSLEQADGTAWMAFFCVYMLKIALELAEADHVYEDIASKFFEHFVRIVDAMNSVGGCGLWDSLEGFYHDQLRMGTQTLPLRVRSVVGIVPLFAVMVLSTKLMEKLPGFAKRTEWFLKHRQDLSAQISFLEVQTAEEQHSSGDRYRLYLLALANKERATRVLQRVFDETEFLSPHGVRSLSKRYWAQPFRMELNGQQLEVHYTPAESDSTLFGGNSNWRGPIWMPVNYLLLQALERFQHFYGDTLQIPLLGRDGRYENTSLGAVSAMLRERIVSLFLPDRHTGHRPIHGGHAKYATDPHFRDLVLFYEYFDGDTGRGLGASHQTGWTALVASLLLHTAAHRAREQQRQQQQQPSLSASQLVNTEEEEADVQRRHYATNTVRQLPGEFLQQRDLGEAEAVQAVERYLRTDRDNSGSVRLTELVPLLQSLMLGRMRPDDVRRFAHTFFAAADRDASGTLDVEEFLTIYAALERELK